MKEMVRLLSMIAMLAFAHQAWSQGGPPPRGQQPPRGQRPPAEGQQPPAEGQQPPAGETQTPVVEDPEPVTTVEPTPVPVQISEPPIPVDGGAVTNAGIETSPVQPALLSLKSPAAAGEVIVQINGDPGTSWQLQVTSDLVAWSDVAIVEIDVSGVGLADLSSLLGDRNFIRGVSTASVIETPSEGTSGEPETSTGTNNIYTLFSDDVEVYEEGDFIVLRSPGVPNHPSPYYGIGHPLYEAYNGDNDRFRQNPNGIAEQDLVFRVPKNPSVAPNHEATPLGPIGISINGVAFFNQYAGPNNQPLTNEIDSFDQYGGHPAPRDIYHYHIEPLFLSGQVGRDGFLGVLLDGFPVYGPEENGVEITNADLDEFHGHFGPTKNHPEGIYHYHFTDEDPYLNGAGFYGAKGSVTQ